MRPDFSLEDEILFVQSRQRGGYPGAEIVPSGTIVAPVNDHITKGLRLGAFYEMDLLNVLRPTLMECRRLGKVALDVGAHIGNHTLYFRHFVPVHAFEPNPDILPFTRMTIEVNSSTGEVVHSPVTLHEIAVSDAEGHVWLKSKHGNTGSSYVEDDESEGAVKIDARPLDDLELGDVGLIKIDVERHEAQVLDGARTLIKACRPVIVCEAHGDEQIKAIEARLPGYVRSQRYCASPTYIWSPA